MRKQFWYVLVIFGAIVMTVGLSGCPRPNSPPVINPPIPNIVLGVNQQYILDLTDYATDDHDSSQRLYWTLENVNTDLLDASIDSLGHLIVTAGNSVGSDLITLVLHDSKGLIDSQSVLVTIQSVGESFTLTVAVSPLNSGAIAADPVGWSYPADTTVALQATPTNEDWKFSHWEGNVTDTLANPTTIVMNDNQSITAVFQPVAHHFSLNTLVTPAAGGEITKNPAGTSFLEGTTVQLTAIPAASWTFDHWEGNVADTNANPTTIVMNSNQTVTAVFIQEAVTIEITYYSPYGTTGGYIEGLVTGVDPNDCYVATDIEVEEVWWTKPYYTSPRTTINANSTFRCYFTTGGNDIYATRIVVFLLPNSATPPNCDPCLEMPNPPEALASDLVNRTLPPRIISFAGDDWQIKRSDFPAGPGPNYFSDSEQSVWIDGDGLHLAIRWDNGKWKTSEVIRQASSGYGTYIYQFRGRLDILDPNMIFSPFTWETAAYEQNHREMDIEFARWGNAAEYTNAQYVIQPCSACPGCADRCERFRIDLTDQVCDLTCYLVWQPGNVEFRTYYGNYPAGTVPPASALASKWTYGGSLVQEPGNENVRFNFWLYGGQPPQNGQGDEIIVTDFDWQAETPVWDEDGEGEPAIELTHIPEIGSFENLTGKVTGVNPADYNLAWYILVGAGWWTKPFYAWPLTSINTDGSWTCDITTGGIDETATQLAGYLIPVGITPPSCGPCAELPEIPEAVAFIRFDRVSWSSYNNGND